MKDGLEHAKIEQTVELQCTMYLSSKKSFGVSKVFPILIFTITTILSIPLLLIIHWGFCFLNCPVGKECNSTIKGAHEGANHKTARRSGDSPG